MQRQNDPPGNAPKKPPEPAAAFAKARTYPEPQGPFRCDAAPPSFESYREVQPRGDDHHSLYFTIQEEGRAVGAVFNEGGFEGFLEGLGTSFPDRAIKTICLKDDPSSYQTKNLLAVVEEMAEPGNIIVVHGYLSELANNIINLNDALMRGGSTRIGERFERENMTLVVALSFYEKYLFKKVDGPVLDNGGTRGVELPFYNSCAIE